MGNLTLKNDTKYIAQYVAKKGGQVIARIPGLEPSGMMSIPTDATYEVIATAVIDGNTYTSAPRDVSGATRFLAQVVQVRAQGTYEFNLVESASTKSNELQFQKTCLSPVTFTITKDGKPLQNVVVNDSFEAQSVQIGDSFSIYAVVNGVTTDTVTTSNPNATIVAVEDSSDLEHGYFTLDVV